jgi:hypothetical protein
MNTNANITDLSAERKRRDRGYRKRACRDLELMSVRLADYRTAQAAAELLAELNRGEA